MCSWHSCCRSMQDHNLRPSWDNSFTHAARVRVCTHIHERTCIHALGRTHTGTHHGSQPDAPPLSHFATGDLVGSRFVPHSVSKRWPDYSDGPHLLRAVLTGSVGRPTTIRSTAMCDLPTMFSNSSSVADSAHSTAHTLLFTRTRTRTFIFTLTHSCSHSRTRTHTHTHTHTHSHTHTNRTRTLAVS